MGESEVRMWKGERKEGIEDIGEVVMVGEGGGQER